MVPHFRKLSGRTAVRRIRSTTRSSTPSCIERRERPLTANACRPLTGDGRALSPISFETHHHTTLCARGAPLYTTPSHGDVFAPATPTSTPRVSASILAATRAKRCRPTSSISPDGRPTPRARAPGASTATLTAVKRNFMQTKRTATGTTGAATHAVHATTAGMHTT